MLLNARRLRRPAAIEAELRRLLDRLGCTDPIWLSVDADDGAELAARRAAEEGAEVVLAGGGDGTVRAVAAGIRRTPAALGIVPLGTANVLARNLAIPRTLAAAVGVALGPGRRRIDLGEVDSTVFAVAAGIGFDAVMLAGPAAAARRHLGLPAYVVAGLGHLADPAFEARVSLDGAAPLHRSVAAVLVTNVPQLPLGITLQPAARLDDGRLEVVLVEPTGVLGWPRVAASVLARSGSPAVERFQVSSATIETDQVTAREVDGDPIAPSRRLAAQVLPGELEVCVPAAPV